MAWTLDPRRPVGERNLPFILRPKQDIAVVKTDHCVRVGKDAAWDKTREEGATKILMTYATCKLLLVPETVILMGSRAEPLVDKTGDPGTLFAAIDYCIDKLPLWWKNLLHLERNFGHYRNLDNGSTIDGEATSVHFGAGKRATFTIVDELGQVEPAIAESIVFNLSDVSNCNIYNSTHFFGVGHAFYKLLRRKGIEIIKLPWWDNCEKNEGLYTSEKLDEVILLDVGYYQKNYPEILKYGKEVQ